MYWKRRTKGWKNRKRDWEKGEREVKERKKGNQKKDIRLEKEGRREEERET